MVTIRPDTPRKRKRRRIGRGGTRRVSKRALQSRAFQQVRNTAMLAGFNKDVRHVDHLVNLTLDTTGDIILLNGLQKGDEYYQREGQKIHMLSVEGHMWLAPQSSSDPQAVQVALVYDKFPNQSTPAYEDIFRAQYLVSGAPINPAPGPLQPRNAAYANRFKVIKNARVTYAGHNTTARMIVRDLPFEWYFNLGMMETLYDRNGNNGTIADIIQGAFFLVAISTEPSASGENVDLKGYLRVRYITG